MIKNYWKNLLEVEKDLNSQVKLWKNIISEKQSLSQDEFEEVQGITNK